MQTPALCRFWVCLAHISLVLWCDKTLAGNKLEKYSSAVLCKKNTPYAHVNKKQTNYKNRIFFIFNFIFLYLQIQTWYWSFEAVVCCVSQNLTVDDEHSIASLSLASTLNINPKYRQTSAVNIKAFTF